MDENYILLGNENIEFYGFKKINDRAMVQFASEKIAVRPLEESREARDNEIFIALDRKADAEERILVSDNELFMNELRRRKYDRMDFMYFDMSQSYIQI